jgi:hypothetical protein
MAILAALGELIPGWRRELQAKEPPTQGAVAPEIESLPEQGANAEA